MRAILLLLAFLLAHLATAQLKSNTATAYLKEEPPGLIPKLFAADVVSKNDQYEYGSIFSADGSEFYFAVSVFGRSEIRFMELVDGEWTKPKTLLTHDTYSYNDPFLSPDERRLFFISDRPMTSESSNKKDYDIWYIERNESGWSEPVNAGPAINSEKNEYYISFSKSGTMYFSSNISAPDENINDYDIYTSRIEDGEFQQAVKLPGLVNTKHYEADVFVAPDESFIIFCAILPGGYGRGDLYISFKNSDDTWAKSKNMGNQINTTGHELCPFISADGRYLFYTGNDGIYWVDSGIISNLRR